jgi:hypothetical protein
VACRTIGRQGRELLLCTEVRVRFECRLAKEGGANGAFRLRKPIQPVFESRDELTEARVRAVQRLWHLTFDMRGAQKAQPFGHPLDGRVRRRLAHSSVLQTNAYLHFLQSVFIEAVPSLHSVRIGSAFLAGRTGAGPAVVGAFVPAAELPCV